MKQFKFNERQRFSIRKFSMGAASVLLGSVFFAVSSVEDVQAAEQSQNVVGVNENKQTPDPVILSNSSTTGVSTEETNTSLSATNVENKPEGDVIGSSKETLNKTALTKLIEDIDGKFTNGKYASKTEDSVNQLKTALNEAKSVLNNAKTQAELSQAHANLIVATTKLQTKKEDKKEAPAVDTTNGKPTVGKKATNTEKVSNSNSIANSGSRDERHGKALDRSNPFRTDATTTDTHANNEAGVSIINGNFEEGTVKPTGNEKIVTNDASKVVGWHVVDPKQTEIPIVNATTRYVGSVDRNHPYGVLLAGYLRDHTNLNAGTEKVETIGKIYQDINVTPGSEVIVKYRTASFGAVGGFSTVKMTVKNPDTGEVYYSGMPNRQGGFSDGLAFINVPKNITKIRLEFEDADPYSRSSTGKDRFLSKNGTLLYPSGILTNVRVNTGAYVVAKENQTEYEVTSTSNNASTTSKDITVKVENKGWEATARGVKYKVDLPQGVTATYGGRTYSGTMEIDLGAIGNKTEKNFTYRLNIPAGTPSITNLVGKVEYKTWQNSEAVPYGETKTGVVPIPHQNVVLKMFKTELETAVAGAANLNQNEYTPDSWKKFQDEITKAREILNEEQNNVPVNQRKSQNEINNQVSLLRAKQNSLTVAATTTEKNNLSAKVAELTKASTVNKTPKSIDEYNKEFKKFEQDYNSIKTEVSNIIAKGDNATRTEVDAALSKVAEVRRKLDTAAGLLVNKGNKTELEKAVREESNVKGNFKYYNADKTKRDAYDSAITSGKDVINNPNATQAEVDAAKQAIDTAKGNLDGAPTTTGELEKATSTDAETTKTTNAKYYNGSEAQKAAYDKAVEDGKKVLAKANVTQAEVDAAKQAIDTAKGNLDGAPTTTGELEKATSTDAETTKTTNAKYYNGSEAQKAAYDKAVEDGKKVLAKANVTQAEVDAAKQAIDTAKGNLDGAPTTTGELEKATSTDAETTKTTNAKYYNGSEAQKAAYDKAVEDGKKVLAKANVTQAEVDAAKQAIDTAKGNLDGAPTTTGELEKATSTDAETTKTTNAKYYNGSEAQKAAYDKAVEDGKKVLAKANVTQAEVDAAKQAIDTAKGNLDGAPTTTGELEKATSTDAETTKTTNAKYYNGSEAQKAAYDKAVEDGKKVLAKANVTQAEVDAAKQAIDTAKGNLDGAPTTTGELEKATSTDAETTKTTNAKYYNGSEAQKAAYDKAVEDGKKVLAKANVTQAEVDAAKQAIDTAKGNLDGAPTTTGELEKATSTDAETTKTTNAKYYNGSEAQKAAYDKAVEDGKKVLAKANVTQAEVDAAKQAIDTAKGNLDGAPTTTGELEKATSTDAETTKTTNAKYYNGSEAQKAAYDKAVEDGKKVLAKANVTQAEVDAAKQAIDTAKGNLDGAPTTTGELEKATSTDAETTKTTNAKYYNGSEAQKAAYDKAVEDGKKVLAKANVTQAEVDAAKQAIDTAKGNLDGAPTTTGELEKATSTDAETTKTTNAKYYNGSEAQKAAYDKAVEDGKKVLAKANVTQAEVDAAKQAIDTAKGNLDGAPTTTGELEKATSTDAETTKTTNAKYYNGSEAQKAAYDKAVEDGKKVLAKANVTQAEVDAAKQAIDTAKGNLDGAPTTTGELEKATSTDAETTKTTNAKYYNGSEAQKAAYDKAVEDGKKVLAKANVTQAEVDAAKQAIDTAKGNLDGAPTTTGELEKATSTDAETTKTTNAKYYNGSEAQKAAYDKAVEDGKKVLAKANVTQAEVDAAKQAIDTAKGNLDGAPTTTGELEKATSTDAETTKTTNAKYYNGSEAQKAAYDKAVEDGKKVLAKANVTQAEVDAAKQAIDTAKGNLDGAPTTTGELEKATSTDAETTKTTNAKYYNGSEAQKAAYDKAVEDGKKVLAKANVTQAEVDAAKQAIDTAKGNLDGAPTTTGELEKATSTDAETTKTTNAKYYNGSEAQKAAYDKAVEDGKKVLAKANVTQAEVDAAKQAIDTAKGNLDGAPTTTGELEKATSTDAETTKTTNAKYYNGSEAQKAAYDKAVEDGKKVLAKANVTQAEVDAAKQAIDTAKGNLDGAPTTTGELEKATSTDAETTKTTNAKYYNGSEAQKAAYDKAVEDGKKVLAKANVTQAEVDAAKQAIDTAKGNLDGAPTTTGELEKATSTDAETTKTTNAKYYNGSEAQKAAYDKAVEDGKKVLAKANVTQAEVDAAKQAIDTAKGNLDGAPTTTGELEKATSTDAETTKTTNAKYYNGSEAQKAAYDKAVEDGKKVLAKANVTQAEVDAAKQAIDTAKGNLDGAPTTTGELEKATSTDAETTKTTNAKYYNGSEAQKAAYDKAVEDGKKVLAKANVTQAEVDAAKQAIDTAKGNLDGAPTTTGELEKATSTDAETTKTTNAKYYNGSEAQKAAYDKAVEDGKKVLAKANVTQAEVDAAKQAIDTAKGNLDGAPTTTGELEKATSTDAETTKTTNAKYYNGSEAQKAAYDKAVEDGKKVLAKANVTQAEVDAAKQAIDTAKGNLDGAPTTTGELEKATSTDAETTKTTNAKYYNGSEAQKAAYDKAVEDGKKVLAKANVTQAEVDAAKQAIDTAKGNLDGAPTTTGELEKATSTDAETTKTTNAKYYNGSEAQKAAYDKAVEDGKKVLAKANVTQAEVDAAKQAIDTAKGNLDGAPTTTGELEKATSTDAETTKTTNAKYYNGSEAQKAAYDKAVEDGKKVLAKANVTQAEVDAAKQAIDTAKGNLDGAPTTTGELEKATSTDAETTKTTNAKYYNGSEAQKAAYDKAVEDGKKVLAKANVTQAEVDAAKQAIDTAKGNLDGAPTTTGELEKATSTDAETTKTTNAKYYNGSEAQKAAYDKAVEDGKKVLAKANVTQAEVDAAKQAIDTAKGNLDGAPTTTGELEKATSTDAETTKTTNAKYYNGSEAQKAAYDKAVEDGKKVLAKANVTQAEVDAAKQAIDTAKGNLDGAPTTTGELEKATSTDAETTKTTNAKYYNGSEAQKAAYDKAVEDGKKVLAKANVTQAEVDAAKQAIDTAKGNLDGAPTTTGELEKATSTDAETTKTTNAKYYNGSEAQKAAYDKAVEDGKKVLAKANVTQAEVDAAKQAIDTAKGNLDGAETDKAQLTNNNDVLNELISEDPTNGKTKATIDEYKKVKEESEKLLKEIKKVIDNKNASQIEVNKALEMVVKAKDSLENAKKSLLDAVEAREVVETIANEKIASIKADKKLSVQEKEKAIDRVDRLKEKALEEIDKSKKQTEIDKALRTFLYQMDQDSLVYERPSFDLEAFIQSSITGVVTVERGKVISQADVISKLNLPENVTVISVDLPDTTTLGRKFAKVTLRLADGKEITVKVPVRVVASQSGESKPETSLPDYGRNNGSTNTDAKVDKAKLEGAIRQLDELIIRESAKLDAETAKEANALSADAKKVFANADTSQAEVDAMIKRIEDFMAKVALSTDHATPTNDQAVQTPAVAPATTQANTRKVAKELPNTGTVDSVVSMVVAAASALLGLGLAGRRRKEDEEA